MRNRKGYVYLLTNKTNKVIYTGVTSNLEKRIYEHRNKLIYYEIFDSIEYAIEREKQIKAGSRQKKVDLTESFNPDFTDLYEKL